MGACRFLVQRSRFGPANTRTAGVPPACARRGLARLVLVRDSTGGPVDGQTRDNGPDPLPRRFGRCYSGATPGPPDVMSVRPGGGLISPRGDPADWFGARQFDGCEAGVARRPR